MVELCGCLAKPSLKAFFKCYLELEKNCALIKKREENGMFASGNYLKINICAGNVLRE